MPNPISIKTIANKGKVFDLTARTDVIALIGYVAPLTTKRALETRTPSCSKKICSLISAPDSVSLTPPAGADKPKRSGGLAVPLAGFVRCDDAIPFVDAAYIQLRWHRPCQPLEGYLSTQIN